MVEAWGVDTLFRSLFNSLPPLPRALETHIRFYQSVVMLVQATRRSKMSPNLPERHCIISPDSLCSHATVIQSELVEIHMHAFQKEGAKEEERRTNGEQAASFS